MDKHQVESRIKEATGRVRDEPGDTPHEISVHDRGKIERGIGKVQSTFGDLESDVQSDVEEEPK